MATEDDESKMAMAIIGLVWLPASFFLWSWFFITCWGWFMVPLGAPEVSKWHVMGLAIMVSAAGQTVITEKDAKLSRLIGGQIGKFIFCFALAWIYHLAMKG